MNTRSLRQGSAAIVAIVIITIGIAGLVGYVVYSNFMAPTETTEQEVRATEEPKVVAKKYENETYSFEYPKEYWTLSEEQYGVDSSGSTPVIRTSNWEQIGMGLEAGAEVAIYTSPATQSLAAMKEDAASFANGAAKDMRDTDVDGVNAYTYNLDYEGLRYHTVFIHNGQAYDIIYQHAPNVQPGFYYNGYDTVVQTFTFKE